MPRRRRFPNRGFMLALIGLIVVLLGYVFGLAWWQSILYPDYSFRRLLAPRAVDMILVVWLLWVGSAIGSFLNVVVWRMPRGNSINGRSHCPRCQSRLRARDNFPVFGWLALGGRCRSCRLPISSRYPIVEAVVGLSITIMGVTELFRLALPYQVTHWHGGPIWTAIIDAPLLWTLLYHITVLACVWALGLIRMDGNRLPARLVVFSLLVATAPLLVYPRLMVVPWQMRTPADWFPLQQMPDRLVYQSDYLLDAVMRIVSAVVASIFFARLLARRLCPAADPKLNPLGSDTARLIDLVVIIALPVIVIGWQSSPGLLLLNVLLALALRSVLPPGIDSFGRFAIAMPITLTIGLSSWRLLDAASWWPGVDKSPWTLIAHAAALLVASLWLSDREAENVSIEQNEEGRTSNDTSV